MRLGAFLSGLNEGIDTGTRIADLIKQRGLNDVRQKAIEEAKADRGNDIEGQISIENTDQPKNPLVNKDYTGMSDETQPALIDTNISQLNETKAPYLSKLPEQNNNVASLGISPLIQAADNYGSNELAKNGISKENMPSNSQNSTAFSSPEFKYKVGDSTFSTRDEAKKAATNQVKDESHYIADKLGNALYNKYLEYGDIEKAKQWKDWAENENNKSASVDWVRARIALGNGDAESAAAPGAKWFEHINPGAKVLAHKAHYDQDGKVAGIDYEFRDSSGKKSNVFLSPSVMTDLLNTENPQKYVEHNLKLAEIGAKSNADFASKVQEKEWEIANADRDPKLKLERDKLGYLIDSLGVRTRQGDARIDLQGSAEQRKGIEANNKRSKFDSDTGMTTTIGSPVNVYGQNKNRGSEASAMKNQLGTLPSNQEQSPESIASNLSAIDKEIHNARTPQQRQILINERNNISAQSNSINQAPQSTPQISQQITGIPKEEVKIAVKKVADLQNAKQQALVSNQTIDGIVKKIDNGAFTGGGANLATSLLSALPTNLLPKDIENRLTSTQVLDKDAANLLIGGLKNSFSGTGRVLQTEFESWKQANVGKHLTEDAIKQLLTITAKANKHTISDADSAQEHLSKNNHLRGWRSSMDLEQEKNPYQTVQNLISSEDKNKNNNRPNLNSFSKNSNQNRPSLSSFYRK